MADERTPAGEGGAVSVRVSKEAGWRVHVPTYLLIAIGVALNGGTCSKQEDVSARLARLEVAVARIEGRLDPRLAATSGSEGAGGTGALPGN